MSDDKWFSKAGSLDDSLDSSTTSMPTSVEPAVISNEPIRFNNDSSTVSTYIKPVKGLNEKTVTTVRTEPKISIIDSSNMYVASVKEETRCNKCGATIPQGTTLCWKCSVSASGTDGKDVKPEKYECVSSQPVVQRKYIKPLITVAVCLVVILIIGIVVATSISQKINLKKLVCTDEILNYYLDDETVIESSVQSFEVLSSRTKDKHDSSEVKVVLKDDFLERTLYISTESTKYKQGWEVDSISITDSDYQIVGEVNQNYIASKLGKDKSVTFNDGGGWMPRGVNGVEKGFNNISLLNSHVDGYKYFADYSVEDRYTYADITGKISVVVDVNMYYAANVGIAKLKVVVEDIDVSTTWHDIEGTYLLSIPEHENQMQYVTIDSDFNSQGYRECVAERYDNAVHSVDLSGSILTRNYSTVVVRVVDPGDYYSYCATYFEYIIFTPDEIHCEYISEEGWRNYKTYTFERLN